MSVEELVQYYSNLLIIQYHGKPKAKAMLEVFIRELLANNLIIDLQNGFNIDTAVGVQLDMIGVWVGVNRYYKGQFFDDDTFSFITYDEIGGAIASNRTGFSDYSDMETKSGNWLMYKDIISSNRVLTDADYRIIIKLKILQNNINHSHKEIDEGLYRFFGTTVYATSTNAMDIVYNVPADLSAIMEVALLKQVFPKPMGVELQINII